MISTILNVISRSCEIDEKMQVKVCLRVSQNVWLELYDKYGSLRRCFSENFPTEQSILRTKGINCKCFRLPGRNQRIPRFVTR